MLWPLTRASSSSNWQPIGDEDGLVRPMRAEEPAVAEVEPPPVELEASWAPEAGRAGGEAAGPVTGYDDHPIRSYRMGIIRWSSDWEMIKQGWCGDRVIIVWRLWVWTRDREKERGPVGHIRWDKFKSEEWLQNLCTAMNNWDRGEWKDAIVIHSQKKQGTVEFDYSRQNFSLSLYILDVGMCKLGFGILVVSFMGFRIPGVSCPKGFVFCYTLRKAETVVTTHHGQESWLLVVLSGIWD